MRKLTNEGFTLLETLIALAIMAIAFSSILVVESGAIRTSEKSKQLNIVAMLARNAMAEAEHVIENKKFEEIKTEEKGEFPEPFKDYTWTREVKEVEFPVLNFGGGGDNKSAEENQSQAMVERIAKLISKFISEAVREVQVTVQWKQGSGFQKFTVSTYWVDLTHDFPLNE